ncbi:MAG: dicarboxylate/amino acid:cation symporter [Verrucomicrobiaceae bacterium]|nr:dicarboxylate/amino acid:cation symporter [Verrucomicrobiaceae bacterium]
MLMFLRKISLVWYNIFAFVFGAISGVMVEYFLGDNKDIFNDIIAVVSPFGTLLVAMLKTIVIPIIFFSLVSGTSSLPLKKFGKLGIKVICFYMITSLMATIFGIIVASWFSPSVSGVSNEVSPLLAQVESIKASGGENVNPIVSMVLGAFVNPFQALAESKFLSIIVFAILFGLASRAVMENAKSIESESVAKMLQVFDGINKGVFKMVGWFLYYFPIGIFSLAFVNFASYGVGLVNSYAEIAGCVILGILLMLFFVYPAIIFVVCRENPYKIMLKIREPIITAFATRSSAATLPISLRCAEQNLKIRSEVSSFSLSLGATVNMDGVCLHLPVFVILAASMFGIDISMYQMFLVVLSVVFASIGVGGVPGGSIFLLFMVLDVLHLSPEQTSTIVALALGINPLLDMFETACNVAGDNVGNYVVAKTSNMLDSYS